MDYQIRKAGMEDLDGILSLYASARKFMAAHGNETQWGQNYPSQELVCRDIDRENLYVITDTHQIHGVFYFNTEEDPTYAKIYDGTWSLGKPYGVIHRIAGDGSGGILQTAVTFAFSESNYLRIDTHADNYVMQEALQKQGFLKCGIIYIEDGSPRIAYDAFKGVREAKEKDLQDILKLYCHLHETTVPEGCPWLENTWKQILNDHNHHLLVYEERGKILSSCVCVVIPNLTRGVQPYALVENVVTHRAHRRKGYASACLAAARKIAEKAGCYKIMLLTGAKEESTLRFYKRAGYNSSDKTAFVQWLNK